MPLRLQESDPYSRQIVLLHLAMLESSMLKIPLYLGMCDCAKARQGGILLMSNSDRAECIFCRQIVQLEELPLPPYKWKETY